MEWRIGGLDAVGEPPRLPLQWMISVLVAVLIAVVIQGFFVLLLVMDEDNEDDVVCLLFFFCFLFSLAVSCYCWCYGGTGLIDCEHINKVGRANSYANM